MSVTGVGDRGSVAGSGIRHAHHLEHDSGQRGGVTGNHVRIGNGRVEILHAHGSVTLGTLVIVHLNQVQMVLPGGEVHVVMARTAHGAAGSRLPVVGLRRSTGVAGGAVARILGKHDGRIIDHAAAVHNLVLSSRFHARKARAHVNLVDEDLHIDGVQSIGIGALRSVAKHAVSHQRARSAVRRERGHGTHCGLTFH